MAARRIPVGSSSAGKFVKWSDVKVGTEYEGIFSGLHEGKYGPLVDLDTRQGRLTFPAPVALGRQLDRVRVGAHVAIVYGGKQHNPNTDRDYHAFEVFVTDGADLTTRAADTF
jgi:hypothetical protein